MPKRKTHECEEIQKHENVKIEKMKSWGWCFLILSDPIKDSWCLAKIIYCPYCKEELNMRDIIITDTHGNLKTVKSNIPDKLLCQDPDCNRYLKGKNQKYCSIKCKNRNIWKKK